MRRLAVLLATAALFAACGGSGPKTAADLFPTGPRDQAYTPVIVTSESGVGDNPLLFSLVGKDQLPVAAPDLTADPALYDLSSTSLGPTPRAITAVAWTIP